MQEQGFLVPAFGSVDMTDAVILQTLPSCLCCLPALPVKPAALGVPVEMRVVAEGGSYRSCCASALGRSESTKGILFFGVITASPRVSFSPKGNQWKWLITKRRDVVLKSEVVEAEGWQPEVVVSVLTPVSLPAFSSYLLVHFFQLPY